ncbi:heme-binding protein [Sphingobium sp. SA2]|uniref:GlcG/HbpS family heme-binding protein n=1 Tax=Sphingobium sp. SA2 TaxID=1524832 RepID=UPI0028C1BEF8|nr:heme-binding protein [Sphingobium sp. SA2]MDT7532022.1 heme-binding protein [Sphingobium sp. SA2]
MRSKQMLTADDAAAINAACKRHGWIVSVAVVDGGGHVMHLVRHDGAGYGTPDVALRKARTSTMTRKPSGVAEIATLDRLTILAFNDRLPLQGALPMIVDGQCVGAVGVSGATSPQDEQIAQAGIDALGLLTG